MGQFVKEISDGDFDIVQHAALPVLVDFGAAWCRPCKMIEPILETLAEEKQAEVIILKVDVDKCPNLSQQFGIRSVPTLILFNKGEIVEQKIGALSKGAIEDLISMA